MLNKRINKNGQKKCPKCGSTDISQNKKTGKLRCDFCHYEFDFEKLDEIEKDLTKLEGDIIGAGAKSIFSDAKDILTLKCESCGAEIVIDTKESLQSRCHWCRNTLSINQQISNGAVPDLILPFSVSKEEATLKIQEFIKKRLFYANQKFKEEFMIENIMGVYFPYLVVDINAHSKFEGNGEILIRSYSFMKGRAYDTDVYSVKREFDITIDNLTIESNEMKLNYKDNNKTMDIINSIMPFDVENAVKWDANYLKGYTSEKRDINIEEIKCLINEQVGDIARHKINKTLEKYDRGVHWEIDTTDIKGYQWLAGYLPVWIYSYQQVKKNKKVMHYVTVNARTKETMGSIPVCIPKLLFVSILIEICVIVAMFFIPWGGDFILLSLGFVYFFLVYNKYRNKGVRHSYEKETETEIKNLKSEDKLLKRVSGTVLPNVANQNNLKINRRTYTQLKEEQQSKMKKTIEK